MAEDLLNFELPREYLSPLRRLRRTALGVLPDRAKDFIMAVRKGYPLNPEMREPYEAHLLGYAARFRIENWTDYNRIVSQPESGGEFSRDLIETVASGVRAASFRDPYTFFDGGSAQGYYTILGAVTGAEVFAFDPDRLSEKAIKENLKLNPSVRMRVEHHLLALGSKAGTMLLHADNRGRHAPSFVKTVKGLNDDYEVKVDSVDNLVAKGVVPMPDCVKIDVEGAEGLVLDGMVQALESDERPKDIFIELHPKYLPLFETNAYAVAGKLLGRGYRPVSNIRRVTEFQCHFQAV